MTNTDITTTTEPTTCTVALPYADVQEAIRLLAITAQAKGIRPALGCIHVEWYAEGVRLVSTDSYILATTELGVVSGDMIRTTMIDEPVKVAKMLKDNAVKYGQPTVVLSTDGTTFTVTGGFGSFSLPSPDLDFPRWQSLLPSEDRPSGCKVALSDYTLQKLAKLGKGATLLLDNIDPLKPSTFKVRHGDIVVTGIFMPVRVS